jgi:hypothetical protein
MLCYAKAETARGGGHAFRKLHFLVDEMDVHVTSSFEPSSYGMASS